MLGVWVLAGGFRVGPDLVWFAACVQHHGACEIGVVVLAVDVHHGAILAQDKNCCRIERAFIEALRFSFCTFIVSFAPWLALLKS